MAVVNPERKIKTLAELATIITNLKTEGKTVCQSHGVWDVKHPGHEAHFQAAKKHGDILIVTVTPDRFVEKGVGRPVFNEQLRILSLASLEYVDYVALNEWPTAVETIKLLKPTFYCKGEEFAGNRDDDAQIGAIYAEKEAVEAVGGELYITPTGMGHISSSNLINHYFDVLPDTTRAFIDDFKQRNSLESILLQLKQLETLRVLVIGELFFDTYSYVLPLGKSHKDEVLATACEREEMFLGGAAIGANVAAHFCQNVSLLSAVGADMNDRAWLEEQLQKVSHCYFYNSPAGTIRKQRFLSATTLHKIFEVSYWKRAELLHPKDAQTLNTYLAAHARDYDALLVMDYGLGLLTTSTIQALTEHAPFLAIYAQTNSQNIGFNLVQQKYPRADFVFLDELDLRLATHNQYEDLGASAQQVGQALNATQLIVTQDMTSSIVCNNGTCQAIPSFVPAQHVIDLTGVFDTQFTLTALCAAQQMPPEITSFIGNVANALATQIVGSQKALTPVNVRKFIKTLLR